MYVFLVHLFAKSTQPPKWVQHQSSLSGWNLNWHYTAGDYMVYKYIEYKVFDKVAIANALMLWLADVTKWGGFDAVQNGSSYGCAH